MSDERKPRTVPPWHWSVVPGQAWTEHYRLTRRIQHDGQLSGLSGRKEPANPDKSLVDPKTYSD